MWSRDSCSGFLAVSVWQLGCHFYVSRRECKIHICNIIFMSTSTHVIRRYTFDFLIVFGCPPRNHVNVSPRSLVLPMCDIIAMFTSSDVIKIFMSPSWLCLVAVSRNHFLNIPGELDDLCGNSFQIVFKSFKQVTHASPSWLCLVDSTQPILCLASELQIIYVWHRFHVDSKQCHQEIYVSLSGLCLLGRHASIDMSHSGLRHIYLR